MDSSVPPIRYYAHSTPDSTKQDWQLLQVHLQNVADLAGRHASVFGASEWGAAAGLLHDLGKYSSEFQARLEGAPERVDHSTAGAVEARALLRAQSRPLEYIVAGHHGGLQDYGTAVRGLEARLWKPGNLPGYSAYRSEIAIPRRLPASPEMRAIFGAGPFSIAFFIRMLYSCLVDADSLDTERFVNPDRAEVRGSYDPVDRLATRFFRHVEDLAGSAAATPINLLRRQILDECLESAERPPGLFSLTVPTGGGKTLSSMAFAIRHMERHGLRQVVYVLPYTSIIEQNARVMREIFGARNVLEHHSNFDPRSEGEVDDSARELSTLVAENWDVPITVTTNVQFFESLYSNRRSRCRKLHRLSRSVIVLDEAQMLPTPFLRPCLEAVAELVRHFGSTVVFCTATQPRIAGRIAGLPATTEIVSAPETLYDEFRRVRALHLGPLDDGTLSARLAETPRVLCVVNRKAHARRLFELVGARRGDVFHLSANMCPVHRRRVLDRVRGLLQSGDPCCVISTQLIEAGVDIDFPVVYRSMAGIDSIAQAAGRCNREGRLPTPGEVFVFSSTEAHGRAPGWLARTAEIGEMVIGRHDDPLSLAAVSDYFDELYSFEDLDEQRILALFQGQMAESLEFPFEEVSGKFRLIDATEAVIVPYDGEAERAIAALESGDLSRWTLRRLQGYTVSVYPQVLRRLEDANAVHRISERFTVLNDASCYSENIGLEVQGDSHTDLLLVDD